MLTAKAGIIYTLCRFKQMRICNEFSLARTCKKKKTEEKKSTTTQNIAQE